MTHATQYNNNDKTGTKPRKQTTRQANHSVTATKMAISYTCLCGSPEMARIDTGTTWMAPSRCPFKPDNFETRKMENGIPGEVPSYLTSSPPLPNREDSSGGRTLTTTTTPSSDPSHHFILWFCVTFFYFRYLPFFSDHITRRERRDCANPQDDTYRRTSLGSTLQHSCSPRNPQQV